MPTTMSTMRKHVRKLGLVGLGLGCATGLEYSRSAAAATDGRSSATISWERVLERSRAVSATDSRSAAISIVDSVGNTPLLEIKSLSQVFAPHCLVSLFVECVPQCNSVPRAVLVLVSAGSLTRADTVPTTNRDCGGRQATGCRILAKAEYMNPGGSIKDRAALWLIRSAELSGALRPGGTICEGTGGNTGIGLALLANAMGYKCCFAMGRGKVH